MMRYRLGRAILCLLHFLLLPAMAAAQAVHVELQLAPPHLDPTLTASASTAEATYLNVFEGLTAIDREGHVQPRLATRWGLNQAGTALTVTLREGVTFHDGAALDAQTVAFSLRRLLDPETGNPQRHLYRAIDRVEVLSATRLRLHLSRPDALLPFRLGLSAAVIVHPATAATNHLHPIGTGPYRVVEWVPPERLTLALRDDWRGAAPGIREAHFAFTSNRQKLQNGLAEGLIDLYPDISSMASYLQFARRDDYRIEQGEGEGEVILALNHARPPLDDRRVRQALAHAIDKTALVKAIYPAASPTLIGSHFSPSHPAYIDLHDYYPHDPEQARALLAAAGVGELTLTLAVPPTQYAQQGSLLIAEDLEAVGIEVALERLDWTEWLAQVFRAGAYDLSIVAHVEPFDLDIYAREAYYFHYDSAEFRALWERIERTPETVARHALLEAAQRHLAEDAVNVFLFMKPQQAIHKAALGGVRQNAPVPAVPLEELYWK